MSQELMTCADCGMPVAVNEYHPFAACLMFKACHNSDTVRANLAAVMERAKPAGEAEPVAWKFRYPKMPALDRIALPTFTDDPARMQVLVDAGVTAMPLYAAPPAAANPAGIPETKTVDELAMLVRQLVHALRKAAPANPLSVRAMDYLERHGLQGSVLRASPHTEPQKE